MARITRVGVISFPPHQAAEQVEEEEYLKAVFVRERADDLIHSRFTTAVIRRSSRYPPSNKPASSDGTTRLDHVAMAIVRSGGKMDSHVMVMTATSRMQRLP
jgi:hypothetical protein